MIKNVLFDVGKVLLSFDRDDTLAEYARYSETVDEKDFSFGHVFLKDLWDQMETGSLSPRKYYEHFRELSGCRISFRHFLLIWTSHFVPTDEMIEFGRSLRGRYRIYFFSNTDPIHLPQLLYRFPATMFYDGLALSWQLGVRKPDPAFYTAGLEKHGLKAEECLFVDDRPANTQAARALGIESVDFRRPSQTISEMEAILAGN